MSKINDGGPAFSCPEDESNMRNKGMSLRDYFAAKAMQAWFTDRAVYRLANRRRRLYRLRPC